MRVPFRSVLCPTDLSEIGNLAVPVAYQLAGPGGTVHLLHVCEPPYLGNPLYHQFVQGYVPTHDERQAGEDRARNELRRLAPGDAVDHGVRTETHVVQGVNVADAIVEKANEIEAQVVILGTHGRTGLSRLVMGSVASDVMRREGVPVILIHAASPD